MNIETPKIERENAYVLNLHTVSQYKYRKKVPTNNQNALKQHKQINSSISTKKTA